MGVCKMICCTTWPMVDEEGKEHMVEEHVVEWRDHEGGQSVLFRSMGYLRLKDELVGCIPIVESFQLGGVVTMEEKPRHMKLKEVRDDE